MEDRANQESGCERTNCLRCEVREFSLDSILLVSNKGHLAIMENGLLMAHPIVRLGYWMLSHSP
jgi:hypothetical protein